MKLFRTYNYNLDRIEGYEIDGDAIYNIDIADQNPIPALYQSGYLTIKGYDPEFETYILGFPNQDVKEDFDFFLTQVQSKHLTLPTHINI